MLLTIDVGNSRVKVAVFEHNNPIEFFVFDSENTKKNLKIFLKNIQKHKKPYFHR